MSLLYALGIRAYGLLLQLARFVSPKAKSWVEGRRNFWERLPDVKGKNVYWFHCASLGEFDQGLPLMNRLKEENPEIFLLVTFFSPSGYEHYHKRKHQADFVCYLPLDTRRNARKFIHHFAPSRVFFVKYEFWANYIEAARKHGAKIYSVSALFHPEHRFFQWYGGFFRRILGNVDHFFVQNRQSLELLQSIGIGCATICGDTRFDRVIENRRNVQPDALLERFLSGEKALILGSTWPEDESFLEKFLLEKSRETKIILAPHDISESHLKNIEKRFPGIIRRYSDWNGDLQIRMLLIDSIGKLANAYSYGNVAYVGGGFSGSLHNILEPAVFGLPVLFGPKHSRFPEGQHFIDAGAGFSVSTEEELFSAWEFIRTHEAELKHRTEALVNESAGATKKILDFIGK